MDAKQQKAFDTVLKQGLGAVTNPEAAQQVAADAQQRGPASAIAAAVDQALEGVTMAAQQAGVQLTPEIIGPAAKALALLMAAMMVESGFSGDVQELAMQALQEMGVSE
jgi:hypothetical protein